MTLKIEQDYRAGIPQTVTSVLMRGVVWHWTAGGIGRAGAEGTIRHFINSAKTSNASYHILLFREGSTTVAKWIVPVTRAAHSLNPPKAFVPRTNNARERQRFDEVRRILGPRASNPNTGCIAVSFCGMPADLKAALKDPVFRADVQQLARELEGHPQTVDRPHFGHGWIQPSTRYQLDDGHGGADLMIGTVLYASAPPPPPPPPPPQEDDMFEWVTKIRRVEPYWALLAKGGTIRWAPTLVGNKSGEGSYWGPVQADEGEFPEGDWQIVIGHVTGDRWVAGGKDYGTDWMVFSRGTGGQSIGLRVSHVVNRRKTYPYGKANCDDEVKAAIATMVDKGQVRVAADAAAKAIDTIKGMTG